MKQCFIEIILWDKNWILNKFRILKRHVLCIRYDNSHYLAIIDSIPTLIHEDKIERIVFRNVKEVSDKQYLCAKSWLKYNLDLGIKFIDPKNFLKQYMKVITECQMKYK